MFTLREHVISVVNMGIHQTHQSVQIIKGLMEARIKIVGNPRVVCMREAWKQEI